MPQGELLGPLIMKMFDHNNLLVLFLPELFFYNRLMFVHVWRRSFILLENTFIYAAVLLCAIFSFKAIILNKQIHKFNLDGHRQVTRLIKTKKKRKGSIH